MLHRVFHASRVKGTHEIARIADHKQIADPGAEDMLRRHSGIRTADHHRFGMLSMLRRLLPHRVGQTGRVPLLPLIDPVGLHHLLQDRGSLLTPAFV